MTLAVAQLIELRLSSRDDPAVTALIDRCLVVACAAGASDEPNDAAQREYARLCSFLRPLMRDPAVSRS